MKTIHLSPSHELSDTADRRIRGWASAIESQYQAAKKHTAPKEFIHPYIAISRESGVDAGGIAKAVAAKLGWESLDRELLEYMAEHYRWSRSALEFVDERTASWFYEIFGKWLDQQLVTQAEYVSRLGRVVHVAALHSNTVFVGRGIQCILPRELGLSVRLIDRKEHRIQRIVKRLELSPAAAARFVDETDKGRADFVRRYFRHDVADPHIYDLVINLEHTSRESAAELIVRDCKLRFDSS